MEIPVKIEKFKDSLSVFSEDFRKSVSEPNSYITFVVNPLKNLDNVTLHKLREIFKDIKETEINCVYQIDLSSEFKQHPLVRQYFDDGLIYFMEKSSMLTPLSLGQRSGRILDMCGAPGGKTFFAQVLSGNGFEVVLVDNNKNRLYRTEENLRNLGVQKFETLYADSGALSKTHPEFVESFDAVILDAPCSNESKLDFTKTETFKYWNSKLPSKLSKLQKRMISEAVKLVKSGGEIIYSTCTFNTVENEEVISWALKKFPNIAQLPLDFTKYGAENEIVDGIDSVGYRVVPKNGYTGFFVSRLIKN